ncbi:predicted protein, partial [Nematostella vectensis]
AVYLIVVAIVTLLGNSCMCVSILWTSSLHRFTNYLVVSLAISDLMVAVFSLPFRIDQTLHNSHWCLTREACIFWIWVDLVCRCAAFANLALISLDRFIATVFPQKYHRVVTRKTGFLSLASVWINAIVIASLALINWTTPGQEIVGYNNFGCFKFDPYYYTFSAIVAFFVPLNIIVATYSCVFIVAVQNWRSTIKAIHPLPPAFADGNMATKRVALVREIKAAQTLAIVICSFFVCWTPFFVILMVVYWCDSCLRQLNKPINTTFITIMPHITSALNPVIFFCFSRKLRSAFFNFIIVVTRRLRQ